MKYKCATLWHKKPDGTYKRILFERTLISRTRGMETGGARRNGNNRMTVRIFTVSPCEIAPGDRICDGYEISLLPPEEAYIIKDLKENFSVNARLRHYKAECV